MVHTADPIEILRRSSGLSLDAEGMLLHDGEPIQHPGLRQLFQSGLDVLPSGEAIVRIGEQWAYVATLDTPFVIQRLRVHGDQATLRLNTGAHVTVPLAGLRLQLHGDHQLAVIGQPNGHVARLSRRAWHAVALHLDLGEDGRLWLQLGQHRVAVERLAPGT